MSASAIKPVHPAPTSQAPKVGSGAPSSGSANSPPISATGGAKIQPNATGSPVRPSVPSNANHAVAPAMPLSLMQDHKAPGNVLTQPQPTLPRTPEKSKDLSLTPPTGVKPTSNGVEGSPNTSPITAPLPSVEIKNAEDEEDAPIIQAIQNHSPDPAPVVATPTQQPGVVPSAVAQTTPPSAVSTQPSPPSQPVKQDSPPSTAPSTLSNPFSNVNNILDSESDGKNTSSPELTAPELIPAVSPVNTPVQAPATSTTPAPVTTPAAAQPSVSNDSPPKLTPVQSDTAKSRNDLPKPEFKVATPPRNSKRKKDTKLTAEMKDLNPVDDDDRKSKRLRVRTQPYQSPLPELNYMGKYKTMMKAEPSGEKLIVFYKNEFLAVRNAEGGFYVCQAMQNIYKSSARIRIRWLSQEKKDNKLTDVYIPDFYDATDFDCILTNLELKKLDKNKFQLPQEERDRTLSILNRALDAEKGVAENSPVTEEHPDGLDLSLYRNEAQLKKKNTKKSLKKIVQTGDDSTEDSEESRDEQSGDNEDVAKKRKKRKSKSSKRVEKPKTPVKDKVKIGEKDHDRAVRASERERGRERGAALKRRSESVPPTRNAVVKPSPEKKAKVITPEKKAKVAPKPTRKTTSVTADSPIPTRSTKSRTGAKDFPKNSPITRTKERERRGVAVQSRGRKKPGKRGKSLRE